MNKQRRHFTGPEKVTILKRHLVDKVPVSDLCIVISFKGGKKLAVFGEVEGLHGQRLLSNDFWLTKTRFAFFGIGLIHSQDVQITIQRISFLGKERVVLLLGGSNSLLSDF